MRIRSLTGAEAGSATVKLAAAPLDALRRQALSRAPAEQGCGRQRSTDGAGKGRTMTVTSPSESAMQVQISARSSGPARSTDRLSDAAAATGLTRRRSGLAWPRGRTASSARRRRQPQGIGRVPFPGHHPSHGSTKFTDKKILFGKGPPFYDESLQKMLQGSFSHSTRSNFCIILFPLDPALLPERTRTRAPLPHAATTLTRRAARRRSSPTCRASAHSAASPRSASRPSGLTPSASLGSPIATMRGQVSRMESNEPSLRTTARPRVPNTTFGPSRRSPCSRFSQSAATGTSRRSGDEHVDQHYHR